MADKKISQLNNLAGANLDNNDEFVLVDTSADETKAITFGELKTALDTSTGFVRITGDTMTGNLTVPNLITSGNVDGRDVSADGTKLDGIEAGATADQTKADIDALGINATQLNGNASSYFTGYTDTAIANLIDSAPATLDTLNELAAALGDDPNFATTVSTQIGLKLDASAYTAADVLSKLLTVDGSGSGLDADTLDGISSAGFATAAQGALADSAIQSADLATVATTGSYNDLSDTPTLGTAAAADTTDFDAAGTALALSIALG